jgi:uncharacterized spore protein YtfJ
MEVTSSMNQNIDTLFSNIESFTQNEGTLGKAVTQGDMTLIPIISVTIGYGGGNTSGKMTGSATGTTQGTSNAGMDALGLGARISTDAVAVVDSNTNNVNVIPVNANASSMNQLINQLPQMMGKGQGSQSQGQQGQQNQQSQQQS